jgi:hypothetical protein
MPAKALKTVLLPVLGLPIKAIRSTAAGAAGSVKDSATLLCSAVRLDADATRFATAKCYPTTVDQTLERVAEGGRTHRSHSRSRNKAHLPQTSGNAIRTVDADNSSLRTRF